MKHPIKTCLWFDGNAKAAADFYCSAFNNTNITAENQTVVSFTIGEQAFMALNGGPMFKINPSISFFVVCETEAEIDTLWEKLTNGGFVLMSLGEYDWSQKYGWVQDQFGVNWQLSFGKLKNVGQKISPTLMFVGQQCGKAEEAIHFYTSIFNNSSIQGILKYSEAGIDQIGTVKHGQFNLDQNVFMAMDSAYDHKFSFNEGISFVISCDTQSDIDYYWDKLTEGGSEQQCGWLKDKYGVSWQVVPSILGELMSNPEKAPKVVQAFLQMKKFDLEKIKNA